jgi:hypothetical protein
MVRNYAGPYGLKEVRTTIESLIGKLKKVSSLDTTLLLDLEECNRAVASIKSELRGQESFLKQDFLSPFLDTCETVLSQFLETRRERFNTKITLGTRSGRELSKRHLGHASAP